MFWTLIGVIVLLSVILLIIGCGTNKVYLCIPAYITLLALCIYMLIVTGENIIGIIFCAIGILFLLCPLIIIIIELVKKLKNKRKEQD